VPQREAPQPRAVRSFRDRWFLLLAALVFLGIGGGGVYAWRYQVAAKAAAAAEAAAKAAEEKALLASGAEVSFAGPVLARNVLAIPAPIDGTVESVDVQVGTSVAQDQPLARIKNERLASQHEAAKADLDRAAERIGVLESSLISARLEASRSAADSDRARMDAERLDRALKHEELLFREGATARLKFEKIQKDAAAAIAEAEALRAAAAQAAEKIAKITADLDAAKKSVDERNAALEEAQSEIDAAVVTAPVDGLILAVNAKPGDQAASSGTDLFQIAVAADELTVNIEPNPQVAAKLKEGLPALVNILELQMDGIAGELKLGEKGQWRVDFKVADLNVKPGLNAVVRVKLP
jgi:multidrug efflux pump subunit AcrA (membrane-fusion protein)